MTADAELRIRSARQKANEIVESFGIQLPEHIELEDIAWELGAKVIRAPLAGAVARLARVGKRARIRVSDRSRNLGRERFSIAHELGHLVLKHATTLNICQEADLYDFGGSSAAESEANAFASELLLPESMVRRRCEVSPVNLNVVSKIASDFRMSLMATTWRFVQLSSERCALVISKDGRVSWFVKNPTFWPYVLERGEPLDKWSLAFDYFSTGRLDERSQQVDASAWVSSNLRGLEEIVEHSMVISSIDSVLSLLWIPER